MGVPLFYLPAPAGDVYYIRTAHLVGGYLYNFAVDRFKDPATVSWADASFALAEFPGGFAYSQGYEFNFTDTDDETTIVSSVFKQSGSAPSPSDVHVADITHKIVGGWSTDTPILSHCAVPNVLVQVSA